MRGSEYIYGAERVVVAELIKLREVGIDAHFLMLKETRLGSDSDVLGDLIASHDIPITYVSVSGRISLRMILDLRRALLDLNPAVVHTHGLKGDVLGLAACKLARIPVVGEVSGWLFPKDDLTIRFYEWLDAQALKRMDAAIVLSEHYRKMLLKMKYPPGRVRLIYSGIDIEGLRAKVGRVDLRKQLGIDPDRPTVGMLTRLSPEKGVDIFLRAMARVVRHHPEVQGVIYGEAGPDGNEDEKLKLLARDLELEDHIIWAGFVEHAMDALLSLDILAQTSLTEGLPQTVMEGLLMERPVVATPAGGSAELVLHDETGYLTQGFEPAPVAELICRMLDDPETARKLAKNGVRHIEDTFSMDRWAERTIALYREMA